jgi:hypothetical protein
VRFCVCDLDVLQEPARVDFLTIVLFMKNNYIVEKTQGKLKKKESYFDNNVGEWASLVAIQLEHVRRVALEAKLVPGLGLDRIVLVEQMLAGQITPLAAYGQEHVGIGACVVTVTSSNFNFVDDFVRAELFFLDTFPFLIKINTHTKFKLIDFKIKISIKMYITALLRLNLRSKKSRKCGSLIESYEPTLRRREVGVPLNEPPSTDANVDEKNSKFLFLNDWQS